MNRRTTAILLAMLASAAIGPTASAQTKLLRFPDIHGDSVVFCYGGDLWRAPATGGTATRLTAHPGQELFPKFSPDGRWIAFTGQYDGDEQVYVIPSTGGEPRQLTFYPAAGPLPPRGGYDNQVYGWTPDGTSVLFRSFRDTDGIRVETALYTVPATGGLPIPLPMPTSGAGDLSPDGKKIVYSPLFRDFRTWKRYEGGWAQDLWVFDLASHEILPIAPSPRTERDPMWIGDKIYFVSDRDGTLNLYESDATGGAPTQLTKRREWDVRWASSDNDRRIVYELDGELQVYDTRTGDDQRIAVTVPDDGINRRPSRYSAAKNIEDFSLSPKGERAAFVARGDVFTVPIENGPTRNLTDSSDAHDRWARWAPDGSKIAYVSDRSGEDRIYVVDQAQVGTSEAITDDFKGTIYAPEWAPDGKRIAVSDKDGKLWVLTLADRKLVEVADEKRGLIQSYSWSRDGGWLAFTLTDASGFASIHVWGAGDGQVRRITAGMSNDAEPVWDSEGDYLYFLSDREYAPQISSVEWNFAGNRTTAIFALALRKDVKHPFPPKSDEVTVGEEEKKEDEKKDKEKKKEAPPVKIDFEGLGARVARVPATPGNLGGLSARKGHLLWIASGAPYYGRESDVKPALRILDLKERKESTLAEDVSAYSLSADGSKVLLRQAGAYNLLDAKPDAKDKKAVSTKGLMVDRVPAQEWATMFDEVWRRYRDFFYVRNMHGYDWKAIGDRYRALVPFVAHRSDLNYVLGEMIAELNVGHAYIQGGDFDIPERPKVGLPGATFELDRDAGRFRIARIYRGDNQEERYRSPLTEIGVDVHEGDFVLAIDGVELKAGDNPYERLRYKTDPITLTVNDKPRLDGARKATYTPIFSEANLRYHEMTTHNREKVAAATNGRVGYLHIPDMGADGIYEFIKWYYPQIRKEGLVVDVRSNGGGNVSQWIIERLDNKLLGTRFGSLREDAATYPATVFHGHLVALLNETSASDGDIFPYYFRKAGLGPLIGKRSWGGVVGITDTGPLLDGGTVFVPIQATNSETGEYIIEGHGVDPDIEVENDPRSVIAGRDPQLERAIAEVLKRIEAEPRRLPTRPPDPVKTR